MRSFTVRVGGSTTTLEHVCVFFIAVGVSIGFTCVLSAVNYFSITLFHNRMEFLYLCCAVYLPSIPATVLQFMCDRTVDRAIGSKMSYGLRSFVYFLTMGSIMVYLPLGPAKRRIGDPGWHRQPHLLIAVTILGFFSALAYGSFFQLVSILDQKGEKKICTAIFSMGYQGAGIIAMFLSFWTDFKTNPSQLQGLHTTSLH
eukprot:jgi/Bigna1/87536/estExt_fgenesh1_pg.C_210138